MNAAVKKKEEVVNNYPGWDKYNIFDPNQFAVAERTEFLKGICGEMEQDTAVEDLILAYNGKDKVGYDLQQMANYYIVLKNKGARLPKFTRWITGMWAANKEYANFLAAQGQLAAQRKIIMSVDPVDILRSADTPHFFSCFKKENKSAIADRELMHKYQMYEQYQYMPALILEECPGIGIAFVNDENGKVMGRQWMHHAKIKETGEDIVVLTNGGYGCLRGTMVASLLADRGIKVATEYTYGGNKPAGHVAIEYVGCFKKNVHHDLYTWGVNPSVRLIEPVITRK